MLCFTQSPAEALTRFVGERHFSHIAVLTDVNTAQCCWPLVKPALPDATLITIEAGDEHKNLDSLVKVWQALEQCGATRQSLLVNLGGGMVTDLGGLAASTFKRGIAFANVPTTLLSAVDASVGGKTGINFSGLKNEIGLFREAEQVIISTSFLATLPGREIKSGYAEMLKHGMLSSHDDFMRLLHIDFGHIDPATLLAQIEASVQVKQRIVEQDPTEHGLRRALNLGHTAGHALESHALRTGHPVPHGYAVAWGLVVESVISHLRLKLPSADLYALARFVRQHYDAPRITCDDYPTLLSLMHHDKKSQHGEINCTLLSTCGHPVTGQAVTDDEMQEALDIFRDLMGV